MLFLGDRPQHRPPSPTYTPRLREGRQAGLSGCLGLSEGWTLILKFKSHISELSWFNLSKSCSV